MFYLATCKCPRTLSVTLITDCSTPITYLRTSLLAVWKKGRTFAP